VSERPNGAVEFEVDGRKQRVADDPETPLLWVLRDRLGIVSPKYGCGMGVCGACTLLEGDRTVRSCTLPLRLAAGRSFTTLEGLAPKALHPVQRAWLETDVSQCGYCQGGMILEAVALLARSPQPTDEEIDTGLYGVLCRCGTYARVKRAVRRAAEIAAVERAQERSTERSGS